MISVCQREGEPKAEQTPKSLLSVYGKVVGTTLTNIEEVQNKPSNMGPL